MKRLSFPRRMTLFALLLSFLLLTLPGCAQQPSDQQLKQLFTEANRIYNVDDATVFTYGAQEVPLANGIAFHELTDYDKVVDGIFTANAKRELEEAVLGGGPLIVKENDNIYRLSPWKTGSSYVMSQATLQSEADGRYTYEITAQPVSIPEQSLSPITMTLVLVRQGNGYLVDHYRYPEDQSGMQAAPSDDLQERTLRYFDYFRQTPGISMLLEEPYGAFPDEQIAAFAMVTIIRNTPDYDFAVGCTKEQFDAVCQQYFGRTITAYENSKTTLLPSGNIISTGWGFSSLDFVLREYREEPDGSIKAVFTWVHGFMGEGYEPTPQEIITDVQNEALVLFPDTWSIELTFREMTDENGQMYLQFLSSQPWGAPAAPSEESNRLIDGEGLSMGSQTLSFADGSTLDFELQMISGYLMKDSDENYTPGGGIQEGNNYIGEFDLVTSRNGQELSRRSFPTSDLTAIFHGDLAFEPWDYNADGDLEISLGQWGSSSMTFFHLYSVSPDGTITLLQRNLLDLGAAVDTKKFTPIDQGFSTQTYNNADGSYTTHQWVWNGETYLEQEVLS